MPKGILRYALAGALTLAVLVPIGSAWADTPTKAIEGCHSDEWYVNDDGDETGRMPTQTEDGLKFVGGQLVHHKPVPATIYVRNLTPGTYEATPAPSLSSFFSVEIANPDGSGYATLRYDTADDKWNIGGTSVREANPLNLIGKKTRNGDEIEFDAKVLSFGVGYVRNPANGTETTVTSVTFAGRTYDLTCKPEPTTSPSPTTSPTGEPTTPPTTLGGPGTVSVKDATATTVRIRWSATPKGAVAFAVFANGKRFGTIYGHAFRFRGLKRDTTHTFTVRAVGKDGGLGVAGSVKGKTKK